MIVYKDEIMIYDENGKEVGAVHPTPPTKPKKLRSPTTRLDENFNEGIIFTLDVIMIWILF